MPRRVYTLSVYFRCMLTSLTVPLTLLGLLEREPSHGYDLKRDYDAYFGRDKPLPFGQVYATLRRLARDGKVTGGDAEPGAGPDRKRYTITNVGTSEFDAWLGQRERTGHAPADCAVLQGGAGADARPPGRDLPRYSARRSHPAHAGADREIKRTGGLMDALLADHRPAPPRSRSPVD